MPGFRCATSPSSCSLESFTARFSKLCPAGCSRPPSPCLRASQDAVSPGMPGGWYARHSVLVAPRHIFPQALLRAHHSPVHGLGQVAIWIHWPRVDGANSLTCPVRCFGAWPFSLISRWLGQTLPITRLERKLCVLWPLNPKVDWKILNPPKISAGISTCGTSICCSRDAICHHSPQSSPTSTFDGGDWLSPACELPGGAKATDPPLLSIYPYSRLGGDTAQIKGGALCVALSLCPRIELPPLRSFYGSAGFPYLHALQAPPGITVHHEHAHL